jgi:two-component system, LytTR family, sensor histidine kinase AlgZ
MHPLARKKVWLAVYLPVWWLFALMVAEMVRAPGTMAWPEAIWIAAPLCTFFAFVCMAPWYVARPLLRGNAPWTRHILHHAAAAVLACVLWLGGAQVMANLLGLTTQLVPAIPLLIFVGFLLYGLSIAVHYGVLAVESSREASIQARDAELRALKAQIHPHFLFNSLNSIAALTSTNPERARDMAILLSDFLRNTLGLGERASILWRDEVELARTYLEVEKIRFGSRLHVDLDVAEACYDCQVPPLVLQPLIENAIRHGIATLIDGGTVRIAGRVEEGMLSVTVENAFDPDSPPPRRHGHGLRNVRERLGTRFGTAARLSTGSVDSQYRAEMRFPCQRAD